MTKPQMMPEPVVCFHFLGQQSWQRTWNLQQRLMFDAEETVPARITVLLCEHERLITVGRSGSREHIHYTDEQLAREGIPVQWVGRGGGCVLHQSGQLCIYTIVPLQRCGWTVAQYWERFQNGLDAALSQWNIHAQRGQEGEGYWGRSGLIIALGLSVRRRVTCHGAFLNVHPPMQHYGLIDAVPPSSTDPSRPSTMGCLLAERRTPVRMTSVRAALVPALAEAFSSAPYHVQTGHPLLSDPNISRGPVARAS